MCRCQRDIWIGQLWRVGVIPRHQWDSWHQDFDLVTWDTICFLLYDSVFQCKLYCLSVTLTVCLCLWLVVCVLCLCLQLAACVNCLCLIVCACCLCLEVGVCCLWLWLVVGACCLCLVDTVYCLLLGVCACELLSVLVVCVCDSDVRSGDWWQPPLLACLATGNWQGDTYSTYICET